VSISSKELVFTCLHGRRRDHLLFDLGNGIHGRLVEGYSLLLFRFWRTTPFGRLHGFHELFEIFLCMALSLFLGGLVKPFWLILDAGLAIPSSLVVPVIAITLSVAKPVVGVTVTPALGPLNALPLRHWGVIVAAVRAILEPRVRLAPRQPIPAKRVGLIAVLVSEIA
jgi:hypothetical protein